MNKPIPTSIIAYNHKYNQYHTGYDTKAEAISEKKKLVKIGKSVIVKRFDWKSGAANKAHFIFYKLYVR